MAKTYHCSLKLGMGYWFIDRHSRFLLDKQYFLSKCKIPVINNNKNVFTGSCFFLSVKDPDILSPSQLISVVWHDADHLTNAIPANDRPQPW